MGSFQDVADRERLLENGGAIPIFSNDGKEFFQKNATERRRSVRHAQYLLLFNVAMGLLLSLVVAFFCIRYFLCAYFVPFFTKYKVASPQPSPLKGKGLTQKWRFCMLPVRCETAWCAHAIAPSSLVPPQTRSWLPLDAISRAANFPPRFFSGTVPVLCPSPHAFVVESWFSSCVRYP